MKNYITSKKKIYKAMFNIDKQVAKFTDFVPFENYEDYKKLSSEDKKEYNYQLKIYRDWRNIIQTAYDDGVKKGMLKISNYHSIKEK